MGISAAFPRQGLGYELFTPARFRCVCIYMSLSTWGTCVCPCECEHTEDVCTYKSVTMWRTCECEQARMCVCQCECEHMEGMCAPMCTQSRVMQVGKTAQVGGPLFVSQWGWPVSLCHAHRRGYEGPWNPALLLWPSPHALTPELWW